MFSQLQEDIHSLKIMDAFGNIRMEKPLQILVSANIPAIMVTVEAKEALYSKEEFANKQYVDNTVSNAITTTLNLPNIKGISYATTILNCSFPTMHKGHAIRL